LFPSAINKVLAFAANVIVALVAPAVVIMLVPENAAIVNTFNELFTIKYWLLFPDGVGQVNVCPTAPVKYDKIAVLNFL